MIDMKALFTDQIARRASDLHLKVGNHPVIRINGTLHLQRDIWNMDA